MRVKAHEADPVTGDPRTRRIKVKLDDEDVTNRCQEADDEDGYVKLVRPKEIKLGKVKIDYTFGPKPSVCKPT